MTHWPDLEAARQGRPGWRRVGRDYHGPCPVSGAGRDCCFASDGRAGGVALGCRKCGGNGGKLDSESFLAHLAALVGETARHVAAHARKPPEKRRKLRLQNGDEEEYRRGLDGNAAGGGAVTQA